MKNRESRGRLEKLLLRPSHLLNRLLIVWMTLTLLVCLWGVSGNEKYGKGLPTVGWMLVVLAGLHFVLLALKREGFRLHPLVWLPLPFLGYAAMSHFWFSPAPWASAVSLSVSLQAYVLFWVGLHSLRTRKDLFYLLGVLTIVNVFALGGIMFELYFYPMWHPGDGIGRLTDIADFPGGFFHSPERFAAFGLLFLPLFGIGAWMRRLPGPMRILFGFLAIVLSYFLLLVSSPSVVLALILAVFLIPFLSIERPRVRRKSIYGICGACGFVIGGSWLLQAELRTALERTPWQIGELLGAGSDQYVEAVSQRPILGWGAGAIDEMIYRSGGLPAEALESFPANQWIGFVARWGGLGAFIGALTFGYLFLRFLKEWRRLPYKKYTKDEESRIHKAGGHHQRRARKRELGKAPLGKLFIGSLLGGCCLCGVFALGNDSGGSALILYCAALLVAIGVGSMELKEIRMKPGLSRVLVASVPALLAGWAYGVGSAPALAQHYRLLADRQLEDLQGRGSFLFREPWRISELETGYGLALGLVPKHAPAMTGMGRSLLLKAEAGLASDAEIARLALIYFERAKEIQPGNWRNYYDSVLAKERLNAPVEVQRELAEKSRELAPGNPLSALLLAEIIWRSNRDREEVMPLLDQVRRLDPGNPRLQSLEEIINLGG